MGHLIYGGSGRTRIEVDDLVLAHLKAVIIQKLRRNEPFLLTWAQPQDVGGGRAAAWIHPAGDLVWEFDGGKEPELNREALERMMGQTGSNSGLHIDASMVKSLRG